jgi:hypothetical protein
LKIVKYILILSTFSIFIGCRSSSYNVNDNNRPVIETDFNNGAENEANPIISTKPKRISEISTYHFDDTGETIIPSYFVTYEYNEEDLVAKEIGKFESGEVVTERLYDENGYITSSITTINTYDGNSNFSDWGDAYGYFDNLGHNANYQNSYFLNISDVNSIHNVYDNKGMLMEIEYISFGNVVEKLKYVYDEDERVHFRQRYTVDGLIETLSWTQECAYDSQNRVIRESRYDDLNYEWDSIFEYSYLRDNNGSVIFYTDIPNFYNNFSENEYVQNYYKNYYDEEGYLIASIITNANILDGATLKIYNYGESQIENQDMFFAQQEFDFETYQQDYQYRRNIISEFLIQHGTTFDTYHKSTFPGDFIFADFDLNGSEELMGYVIRNNEQKLFMDIYFVNDLGVQLLQSIAIENMDISYMQPKLLDNKLVCAFVYLDTWTFVQNTFYYIENGLVLELNASGLGIKSNGITYRDEIVFPYVYDVNNIIYKNWDERWEVPVKIVNGAISEYQYEVISKNKFEGFDNSEEAILEAREEFMSREGPVGGQSVWPIETKEIRPYEYLLTENNLVFVNFYINFSSIGDMYLENLATGEEVLSNTLTDTWILGCAEYRIVNNVLYLNKVRYGKRNIGNQSEDQEQVELPFE